MSSVEVTIYYGNERHTVEYDFGDITRADGSLLSPTVNEIEWELDRAVRSVKAGLRTSREL